MPPEPGTRPPTVTSPRRLRYGLGCPSRRPRSRQSSSPTATGGRDRRSPSAARPSPALSRRS